MKRAKPVTDSLDLLLDTMCNAFGGIVLIAILVALLVRPPGEDRPSDGVRENAQLLDSRKSELRELLPRLDEIAVEMERVGEKVELINRRDELAAAVAARQEMGAKAVTEMSDRMDRLRMEQAAATERASSLSREIASLEEMEESLMRQLERMDEARKDLIQSRKMEMQRPLDRAREGHQINFVIRFNEIYPVQTFQFDRSGKILNVENNTDGLRWGEREEPIRGKGWTIGGNREEILVLLQGIRLFNRMNRETGNGPMYVISFAYNDSFETMTAFRRLVREVGDIPDGWEPVADDRPLNFGAGGSGTKTEN